MTFNDWFDKVLKVNEAPPFSERDRQLMKIGWKACAEFKDIWPPLEPDESIATDADILQRASEEGVDLHREGKD